MMWSKNALKLDGRHMLQIGATFADLECTTERCHQGFKYRVVTPGTKKQKMECPAHGKPKPGPHAEKVTCLDTQLRNILAFFERL